ncbi:hypothetical protein C2S51_026063 [Perilla frutescens var. frutescens]|nr:hypothetical protein C2S51_026063 [Perilla frutescens var. frutescens]
MATIAALLLILLFLQLFSSSLAGSAASSHSSLSSHFNRGSFPPGFIFGAASASYQSEGAAFEDGKGPSIWDTYTHKFPEKIVDRSNGDVANDFYHRYKDDVKLMKYLKMDTFRMSISWSRILPSGKLSGGINKQGIAFYNNVFIELLANGIVPFVTLFHWDVPQALEDEYGGFLSPRIITADAKAAQRALDFIYGWFMDPVVYGSYPKSMRSIVQNRLPKFSKQQKALLKGSFDFLGLNYYTGNYAAHVLSRTGNITSTSDSMTLLTTVRNGKPIGDPTGVPIFFVYPKGLHDLLVYTKEKYKNPKIYITENGMGDQNNGTIKQLITDPQRIDFYSRHLKAVRRAIGDGVNVKGYIAWSFLDDFEWGSGYTQLFGLCFVDRKNGLKRLPKRSALWYKKFLTKKRT